MAASPSLVALLVVVVANCALPKVAATQSPILLIPGLYGSQLETRVSSSESQCDCCTQWTGLWVNPSRSLVLPECFLNELTLVYNTTTNGYSNTPGVEVRVPGFGDTRTVEHIFPGDITLPFPAYTNELVNYFVQRGYERNKTVRAAPYDWRLAADQLEERGYYSQLQTLVEEMYQYSNEKVTIVGHSMGGPVSLYFLTRVVSQDWKDRYINAYIPLSPAWAGANANLAQILIGSEIYNTAVNRTKETRTAIRSLESTAWLLSPPSIWGDTVILFTPLRNYTANDYEELFETIGYTNGYQMYLGTANINQGYPAPNVPVHCFYGIDVPTLESIRYNTTNFVNGSGVPEIINGAGDGIVNLRSMEVCLRWEEQQQQAFSSRSFPGVDHFEILRSTTVLQAIEEIVVSGTCSTSGCSCCLSSDNYDCCCDDLP